MARIVMKFGGTSTADTTWLRICVARIAEQVANGDQVAVVVSAPAGTTDQLQARLLEIDPKQQYLDEADLVLSSGEQINAGLLAILLREQGIAARSWTGWQAGLICEPDHGQARLLSAECAPVIASLEKGNVAVLTGFQGVTEAGRIVTFGRGGSDLSAVALAHGISADRCDIYTDVPGVFTADPRMEPSAKLIETITPDIMLEMASNGAKVLHSRSVELAKAKKIPLRVCATKTPGPGTRIEEGLETHMVSGVTYTRNKGQINLFGLDRENQSVSQLIQDIGEAGVHIEMMVLSPAEQQSRQNLVLVTSRSDHKNLLAKLQSGKIAHKAKTMQTNSKMARVSVIGLGLLSQSRMMQTFNTALEKANIFAPVIATSELRISALLPDSDIEMAVRALHFAFKLDQQSK